MSVTSQCILGQSLSKLRYDTFKKVNNKDPLLFANPEDRFSQTEAHIIVRESVQHHYYHAGLIARKPVFRVSEEVKLQPVCSATETSQNIESLYDPSLNIALCNK